MRPAFYIFDLIVNVMTGIAGMNDVFPYANFKNHGLLDGRGKIDSF